MNAKASSSILAAILSSATMGVADTHYVVAYSATPIAPYTNWVTAAKIIQDAIDESSDGDLVLVADGNYRAGDIASAVGRSRFSINKAITVKSLNGPAATSVTGKQSPGIRCAYVGPGATLSGFTLTGGQAVVDGGGAYCQGGVLSNCVVTGNSAYGAGGGVYGGTLYNCTIGGNRADPGPLTTRGRGGGVHSSVVYNSTIRNNYAEFIAGGAESCVMHNCLIINNSCLELYGGTSGCHLNNCTVAYNQSGYYWSSGAVHGGNLSNCVVYYNNPGNGNANFNYTCTTPLPAQGVGNFSEPPLFEGGGSYRLQTNSPCVNSGDIAAVGAAVDLDGNPRVVAGYVDVGAFELQSALPPTVYSTVNYTNVVVGFSAAFEAGYHWGRASSATWDFGDGTVVSNTLSPTHSWTNVGIYQVVARVYAPNLPSGLMSTVTVHVASELLYYVSVTGTNPMPPYASWDTAATNIQDAVDVATPAPESIVMVNDGIYESGGRVVTGALTNRLVVAKPITVRSVNGPEATILRGYRVPGTVYGDDAIRCAYLSAHASLVGFSLQGGATRMEGNTTTQQSGGGIWCESTNEVVLDCVLSGNAARWAGGGVYGGSLRNCRIEGNRVEFGTGGGARNARLMNCLLIENASGFNAGAAGQSLLYNCDVSRNSASWNGGGTDSSVLIHCTLTRNTAGVAGGGAFNSTLTNCIVFHNAAPSDANYSGGTYDHCCTWPLAIGNGNIGDIPGLTDGVHLAPDSPCRGAGRADVSLGMDWEGEDWLNPPSIGCDEYDTIPRTGSLDVAIEVVHTNVAAGFAQHFTAVVTGPASVSTWDGMGESLVTNRPAIPLAWTNEGSYPVVLTAFNDSNPGGVSATVTVHVVDQPVHRVALDSPNPVSPYLSWETAATNIQDAVEIAFGGGTVVVSNGVYRTGGKAVFGFLTNRVALKPNVSLMSLNGAESTVIQGGDGIGETAARCAFVPSTSKLVGFTLSNGTTRSEGDQLLEQSGGGVWCESANAAVLDCVLISNSAVYLAGGGYSGTFSNCLFAFNSAQRGGAVCSNTLVDCALLGNAALAYGGAAFGSDLRRCALTANSAFSGGGAHSCTLDSCEVADNTASGSGGGAALCTLRDSTIAGNTAVTGAYREGGGGLLLCTAYNCIVYFNWGPYGANWDFRNFSAMSNCCTIPLPPAGDGNITNAPLFMDTNGWSDLRLLSNSPCINAGNNLYVTSTNDLDGNARIAGGTVDMGAYESQSPASTISYAWLQQYGLPTDGSIDHADGDGDKATTWQEWKAWTNPTNAQSVLRMLMPAYTPHGLLLSWSSESGIDYWVEQTAGLAPPLSFQVLHTNIAGQPTSTTFRHDWAGVAGSAFYRVGTASTNLGSPITMDAPILDPATVELIWQSVAGQSYMIERAASPGGPYTLIESNIVGQAGTTTFIDSTATNEGAFLYRVSVPE